MAAAGASVSSVASCKKCGKRVVNNALKCKSCLSVFHSNCGKLAKVKVLSDDVVLCCATANNPEPDLDEIPRDVLQLNGENYSKRLYETIMEHKDVIIQELRDKINLLNDKIAMMTKIEELQQKQLQSEPHIPPDNCNVKVGKQLSENAKNPTHKKSPKNETNTANTEVHPYVLQKTENKIQSADAHSKEIQRENPWREVRKHRRKSNAIVGTGATSEKLQTVPKSVFVHIYRLHPNTKTNDVLEYVQPMFPEAKCEALVPKHQGVYSSFKLEVYRENINKILDDSIWPPGTCVRRFYEVGKVNSFLNRESLSQKIT